MEHITWAREVFNHRPKPKLFKKKKLRAWQKSIAQKLFEQNDREILWVYDKSGNNGKTILGKYLIDNNVFYTRGGKVNDLTYRYQGEHTIVLDLVRSQEEYTPYKLIETFKDGIIESNKYTSCTKYADKGFCQILVLANYMPEISKCSIDRWNIFELNNNRLRDISPVKPVVGDCLNIKGAINEQVGDDRYYMQNSVCISAIYDDFG